MFTIFDRYVARSYLFSLLVCYTALVGMYLVIDVSGHIAAFYAQSGFWGLLPLVARVYIPRIPLIVHELTPFVVLLAAMFTVGKMHRDNELLCLTVSGVSILRVLRPLFVVAVGITLFYVANRELVLPRLLVNLVEGDTIMSAGDTDVVYNFQRGDGMGNDVFIREYHIFAKEMRGVMITSYFPGEETQGHHVQARLLRAREGRWQRDADGRERWFLYSWQVSFYRPDRTAEARLPLRPRSPEDALPLRRPGEPPQSEGELVTDLEPHQIRRQSEELTYYSTGQLARLVRESPGSDELAASYHRRFASPAAIVVLLLLGLPFALRGYGASTFRSIGIGIFLCFGYYIADAACLYLGTGGTLPPVAAAWLPVLVFGPVGFYLLDSVPS
jgi:lipopolysaccharide export system permease protein